MPEREFDVWVVAILVLKKRPAQPARRVSYAFPHTGIAHADGAASAARRPALRPKKVPSPSEMPLQYP